MRSLGTIDLPSELARLTADLAAETWPPGPGTGPAPAVPGSGPVTVPPANRAWSVPLLVTPETEAWLLGWPAGLVTPAHGHGARHHGRHRGGGRAQRGVPGPDHLDHLPPDDLAGRGHHRVPARPSTGSGAADDGPAVAVMPGQARPVRRPCRRPAWAGWSWRSGWPGPWSTR